MSDDDLQSGDFVEAFDLGDATLTHFYLEDV